MYPHSKLFPGATQSLDVDGMRRPSTYLLDGQTHHAKVGRSITRAAEGHMSLRIANPYIQTRIDRGSSTDTDHKFTVFMSFDMAMMHHDIVEVHALTAGSMNLYNDVAPEGLYFFNKFAERKIIAVVNDGYNTGDTRAFIFSSDVINFDGVTNLHWVVDKTAGSPGDPYVCRIWSNGVEYFADSVINLSSSNSNYNSNKSKRSYFGDGTVYVGKSNVTNPFDETPVTSGTNSNMTIYSFMAADMLAITDPLFFGDLDPEVGHFVPKIPNTDSWTGNSIVLRPDEYQDPIAISTIYNDDTEGDGLIVHNPKGTAIKAAISTPRASAPAMLHMKLGNGDMWMASMKSSATDAYSPSGATLDGDKISYEEVTGFTYSKSGMWNIFDESGTTYDVVETDGAAGSVPSIQIPKGFTGDFEWMLLSAADASDTMGNSDRPVIFWTKDMLRGEYMPLGTEGVRGTTPLFAHKTMEASGAIEFAPVIRDNYEGRIDTNLDIYSYGISLAIEKSADEAFFYMFGNRNKSGSWGVNSCSWRTQVLGGWTVHTGAYGFTGASFSSNVFTDVGAATDYMYIIAAAKYNSGGTDKIVVSNLPGGASGTTNIAYCSVDSSSGLSIDHQFSTSGYRAHAVAVVNDGIEQRTIFMFNDTGDYSNDPIVNILGYANGTTPAGVTGYFNGGAPINNRVSGISGEGGMVAWYDGTAVYVAHMSSTAHTNPSSHETTHLYIEKLDFGTSTTTRVVDFKANVMDGNEGAGGQLRLHEVDGDFYLTFSGVGLAGRNPSVMYVAKWDSANETIEIVHHTSADSEFETVGRMHDAAIWKDGAGDTFILYAQGWNCKLTLFEKKASDTSFKLVQRIDDMGVKGKNVVSSLTTAKVSGGQTVRLSYSHSSEDNVHIIFVFDEEAGCLRFANPMPSTMADIRGHETLIQGQASTTVTTSSATSSEKIRALVGASSEELKITATGDNLVDWNDKSIYSAQPVEVYGETLYLISEEHPTSESVYLSLYRYDRWSGHMAWVAALPTPDGDDWQVSPGWFVGDDGDTYFVYGFDGSPSGDTFLAKINKDYSTEIVDSLSGASTGYNANRFDVIEFKGEHYVLMTGGSTTILHISTVWSSAFTEVYHSSNPTEQIDWAIDDSGELWLAAYSSGIKIWRIASPFATPVLYTVPNQVTGWGAINIHFNSQGKLRAMFAETTTTSAVYFRQWAVSATTLTEETIYAMPEAGKDITPRSPNHIAGHKFGDKYEYYSINTLGANIPEITWDDAETWPEIRVSTNISFTGIGKSGVYQGRPWAFVSSTSTATARRRIIFFNDEQGRWSEYSAFPIDTALALDASPRNQKSAFYFMDEGTTWESKQTHLTGAVSDLAGSITAAGRYPYFTMDVNNADNNYQYAEAYRMSFVPITNSRSFVYNRARTSSIDLDIANAYLLDQQSEVNVPWGEKYAQLVPNAMIDGEAGFTANNGQVEGNEIGLHRFSTNMTDTIWDKYHALDFPFPAASEKSAGKLYFEAFLTASNSIISSGHMIYILDETKYAANGIKIHPTPSSGDNGSVISEGDTLGFLFDYDNNTFTLTINGVNDAALNAVSINGMGRMEVVFVQEYASSYKNVTVNTGQEPFRHAPADASPLTPRSLWDDFSIYDGRKFVANGSWTGTGGGSLNMDFGFKPDIVIIAREGAWGTQMFVRDWGNDKHVDMHQSTFNGGFKGIFTQASGYFTWTDTGFEADTSIGTANDAPPLNTAGVTYHYVALKAGTHSGIDIVRYSGNGSSKTVNHALGGIADAVMVIPETDGANGPSYACRNGGNSYYSGDVHVNNISDYCTFNTGNMGVKLNNFNKSGINYTMIVMKQVYGFSYYGPSNYGADNGNMGLVNTSAASAVELNFGHDAVFFTGIASSNKDYKTVPMHQQNNVDLQSGTFRPITFRSAVGFRADFDRIYTLTNGGGYQVGWSFSWGVSPWGVTQGYR